MPRRVWIVGFVPLGASVALTFSDAKGWFQSIPDWSVASLWIITAWAWFYLLVTSEKGKNWVTAHKWRTWMSFVILGGLLGASSGWLLWWSIRREMPADLKPIPAPTPPPPTKPDPITNFEAIPADKLTLHDLFLYDFSHETNTNKVGGGWTLQGKKQVKQPRLHVEYFVILKMDSNSKFIQFYVPFTKDIFAVCSDLATFYERALKEADEIGIAGRGQPGDSTLNDSRNSVFTGRIFVYSEADLGAEDLGRLTGLYRSKKLELQFRSNTYLEHKQAEQRIKQR